jgi:hypothetical protein
MPVSELPPFARPPATSHLHDTATTGIQDMSYRSRDYWLVDDGHLPPEHCSLDTVRCERHPELPSNLTAGLKSILSHRGV